jgi:hypothetical protein
MLLPKPCMTMNAGRRSPACTPSGILTTPTSFRPSQVNVTLVLGIAQTSLKFRQRWL